MRLMPLLESKRGQAEISQLQALITALVIIGIVAGVGFMVLEKFQAQMTAGSEAAAGVNETVKAMKQIPTWLPIVIIVAIASIILALVFKSFSSTGAGAPPVY